MCYLICLQKTYAKVVSMTPPDLKAVEDAENRVRKLANRLRDRLPADILDDLMIYVKGGETAIAVDALFAWIGDYDIRIGATEFEDFCFCLDYWLPERAEIDKAWLANMISNS